MPPAQVTLYTPEASGRVIRPQSESAPELPLPPAWHAAAPALDAWARTGVTLHVLAADLAACGLAERCDPRVAAVDAAGFLALTEQHATQRAWF